MRFQMSRLCPVLRGDSFNGSVTFRLFFRSWRGSWLLSNNRPVPAGIHFTARPNILDHQQPLCMRAEPDSDAREAFVLVIQAAHQLIGEVGFKQADELSSQRGV